LTLGHHLGVVLLYEPTLDWEFMFGKDGSAAIEAVQQFEFCVWHDWLAVNNNVRSPFNISRDRLD
jgi:hypothetical protein